MVCEQGISPEYVTKTTESYLDDTLSSEVGKISKMIGHISRTPKQQLLKVGHLLNFYCQFGIVTFCVSQL